MDSLTASVETHRWWCCTIMLVVVATSATVGGCTIHEHNGQAAVNRAVANAFPQSAVALEHIQSWERVEKYYGEKWFSLWQNYADDAATQRNLIEFRRVQAVERLLHHRSLIRAVYSSADTKGGMAYTRMINQIDIDIKEVEEQLQDE